MALLLHIETATTVCSVALSGDGKLLAFRELDNGFTHAENLHRFIAEILKETGTEIKHLDAIAVSKGPGSYTGLRIGVSTAKGLAYARNIPLISLDTLQVMSWRATGLKPEAAFFCPMIDARRMEVYTAVYNQPLEQVSPVEALIVDGTALEKFNRFDRLYFFGNGMPKCRGILSAVPGAEFIEGLAPSAKDMYELAEARFAAKEFEDVAYFEPFYLKDFLITKKKS